MPILNTLRLKNRLTEHGMPDDQAQGLVDELDEALTTAVSDQVATRADIADLRGEMNALHAATKADIADLRGKVRGDIKMLRWMGSTLVALVLVVLGLVFTQQQRLATVETTVGQRLTAIETTLDQLKTAVETLRRPQTP